MIQGGEGNPDPGTLHRPIDCAPVVQMIIKNVKDLQTRQLRRTDKIGPNAFDTVILFYLVH